MTYEDEEEDQRLHRGRRLQAAAVRCEPLTHNQPGAQFEHFTDCARRIMMLAYQEAQQHHHASLGTEHILLGLIRARTGVVAHVFRNLDVDLHALQEAIEKRLVPGPSRIRIDKLPMTGRLRASLDHAVDEARSFGHNYIGTEHLLLGLLTECEDVDREDAAEGEALTAELLADHGIDLDAVRRETQHLLNIDRDSGVDAFPAAGEAAAAPSTVSLSGHAADVPAGATRLADKLGHAEANTAHMLLTLLEQDGAHATAALRDARVDLDALRDSLCQRAAQPEAGRA